MSEPSPHAPLIARKAQPLKGAAAPPGDKSVSHRALILAAQAVGLSRVSGLLEAEDVLNTAAAMRQLGAEVARGKDGDWQIYGVGVGGFASPKEPLDFGNSGTGCRLAMGAVATTPLTATFIGDASLSRRPMKRVLEPLEEFGTRWSGRDGGLLPITLTGAVHPVPILYDVKVASAQVKSALLLAALAAPGRTTISQSVKTRDHTERMLRGFGAEVTVDERSGGGDAITVTGEAELKPVTMTVPRDPSSAAFPLVASLLVPGSRVTVQGVMLNPRRTGLFQTLKEMGARLDIGNLREDGGEPVGDVVIDFSPLQGIEVPPERAASQIDEFPILAVAAAFAEGRTVMRGLEELRVKESDRIAAIAAGLKANGVAVEELPDGLVIEGRGPDGVVGGGTVATHMDHRIAMSFLVMGLAAKKSVTVDDGSMIATSFPNFSGLMKNLGADIGPARP